MASDPNDYCYIEGKSTDSLFFFSEGGAPTCKLMWLQADDVVFVVPLTCTKFYSSTMGLLLSEPYCVFNPLSAASLSRPIPSPERTHHDHLPRALVVYKNEDTGYHVFHVLCALPSTDPLYPVGFVHAFDVYSSDTDQWHLSSDHVLGRIRADTNVSCGTRAYWLTETPSVVCYDAEDGSVDILPVPLKFWESGVQHLFQLGQRDVDLCFMVATEMEVEVYTLGFDRQWGCSLRCQYTRPLPAIPLRFQSKKFQLLFWVADHIMVLDTAWSLEEPASSDSHLGVKCLQISPFLPLPSSIVDILPLVKTNLDPNVDFPTGPN